MSDVLDLPSPIAVTGASGYLASWVVEQLLARGVTVHATVRDRARRDRVAHLEKAAAPYPGALRLFEADLLRPGSFDEALAGCAIVLHTASPFLFQKIRDAQSQLVTPAVEGTRNVLASVAKNHSVTRVVLTSSVAAIYDDACDLERAPGRVFTEAQWNESSTVQHNPYSHAKTHAEREAWRIAEAQDRWQLVVLNPGMLLGPSLGDRADSESVTIMRQMADGTNRLGVPELYFGVCDVRDAASAHVLAAGRADAAGRHIVVNRVMSLLEIGRTLRTLFGDRYPFPVSAPPAALLYVVGPLRGLSWRYIRRNLGLPLAFDNRRGVDRLGLSYRAIEDTLRDHIEQLEASGILRPHRAKARRGPSV